MDCFYPILRFQHELMSLLMCKEAMTRSRVLASKLSYVGSCGRFFPQQHHMYFRAKEMRQQFYYNMQDLTAKTVFHSYLASLCNLFSITDLFLFTRCEDNNRANIHFEQIGIRRVFFIFLSVWIQLALIFICNPDCKRHAQKSHPYIAQCSYQSTEVSNTIRY